MKISIETTPFAIDYWYSGTYTKDIGDELEYKERYYDFTIHSSEDSQTITWVDEVPENDGEIEKQILEEFNKII